MQLCMMVMFGALKNNDVASVKVNPTMTLEAMMKAKESRFKIVASTEKMSNAASWDTLTMGRFIRAVAASGKMMEVLKAYYGPAKDIARPRSGPLRAFVRMEKTWHPVYAWGFPGVEARLYKTLGSGERAWNKEGGPHLVAAVYLMIVSGMMREGNQKLKDVSTSKLSRFIASNYVTMEELKGYFANLENKVSRVLNQKEKGPVTEVMKNAWKNAWNVTGTGL